MRLLLFFFFFVLTTVVRCDGSLFFLFFCCCLRFSYCCGCWLVGYCSSPSIYGELWCRSFHTLLYFSFTRFTSSKLQASLIGCVCVLLLLLLKCGRMNTCISCRLLKVAAFFFYVCGCRGCYCSRVPREHMSFLLFLLVLTQRRNTACVAVFFSPNCGTEWHCSLG